MTKNKGCIPNSIFELSTIQKYVKASDQNGLWGYLGHENRCQDSDVLVVYHGRDQGFTDTEIAEFMCSTYGRHFMDLYPELCANKTKFVSSLKGCLKALRDESELNMPNTKGNTKC